MNLPNPYFKEVVDTIADIECWLSGRAGPERLATLMARFSPGFSMITMSGTVLDYAGVDALFSHGHGARPGLVIDIDELRGPPYGPMARRSVIARRRPTRKGGARCGARRPCSGARRMG